MNTEELLKHRMLKFRKIGGFEEGVPVDPEKKVNMKQKDTFTAGETQHLDLESEVEKVRQQILKAKESSTELPLSSLDETIGKLKEEIDLEFSKAINAIGLEDKVFTLREEISKVNSQDQLKNTTFSDKIEKLKDEINQALPTAPNYEILKYNLDMMKELSKAKNLAAKSQKAAKMKQEINRKLKEVMDQKQLKEKFEQLEAEIQNSEFSKFEDLDSDLKEKALNLKKELEFEMVNVLQSLGLNVEGVKSKEKYSNEQTPSLDFKCKIDELNKEIKEGIENVISSSDLKYKIEQLKLEVAKAGMTPGIESKNRITALEQEIKQSLAAALDPSNLKEKHDVLKAEISKSIESTEELDENSFTREETFNRAA